MLSVDAVCVDGDGFSFSFNACISQKGRIVSYVKAASLRGGGIGAAGAAIAAPLFSWNTGHTLRPRNN